jgi:LysR family transcriptional regulator, regulator for bpeEF and oprC
MDRLEAMRLFTRIVESGSFSAVARQSEVSQPTVSKHIAGLETHLGVKLVHRNSRTLRLTEEGQAYYQASVRILTEIDLLESDLRGGQGRPAGSLSVTLSAGFGRLHLVPLIPAFHVLYPNITVEVVVSDRFVDLIEEGIDVALRIGHLPDSALVARLIGSSPRATFAAAEYIERAGQPGTPADLDRHQCVAFTFQRRIREWTFNTPAGRIIYRPVSAFRANDAENVRAAVLAGMGICQTPRWLFAAELRSGEVKEILADFPSDRMPIHAVYPASGRRSGKLQAFVDFLVKAFAEDPRVSSTNPSIPK